MFNCAFINQFFRDTHQNSTKFSSDLEQNSKNLGEELQYWKCRGALEQSEENINLAVGWYKSYSNCISFIVLFKKGL